MKTKRKKSMRRGEHNSDGGTMPGGNVSRQCEDNVGVIDASHWGVRYITSTLQGWRGTFAHFSWLRNHRPSLSSPFRDACRQWLRVMSSSGHRELGESNIVLVGGVPKDGLIPGTTYWVISEGGVVGELITNTPLARRFLGEVTYLGTVIDAAGRTLTLQEFAVPPVARFKDHGAPISLIVGTGPEVGKTTAGLGLLRTFLAKGHTTVIVLKATGTSSFAEIANYQDYGAAQVFDCVDFGLPTTYPSERKDMQRIFDRALDTCLTMPADAVVIECGGDMLAANIPVFLKRLKRRRSRATVVLAAADPLGAFGGTQMLRDIGLPANLITGPCTDTPASQQRTKSLCKTPAMNMLRRGELIHDDSPVGSKN